MRDISDITNELANLYHDIVLQKKCSSEQTICLALSEEGFDVDASAVLCKHLLQACILDKIGKNTKQIDNANEGIKNTLPEKTIDFKSIKKAGKSELETEDEVRRKAKTMNTSVLENGSLTKKCHSTGSIKFPLEAGGKKHDEDMRVEIV